ncbi:hypothetical protein JFU47_05335 [Pseudomonas sp. TH39(2020)]|uniref:hypothetical protein n=1 Tax=Pseudomonas sp. TH39(2020) TaxID=2796349 RepID=UPI001912BB3D|nr:hypothetical protein [Pseudomonas sp. TH39(2020)]MBK5396151.1 hypothetical protein [Pseudomonas sp. TH39(2020)]
MSVVSEFEDCLENELARSENDEWFLSHTREAIIARLEPDEAYAALAFALKLTAKQDSPFHFASCCWFVLALARKADTTQLPTDAFSIVPALETKAGQLCEQHELEEVFKWFRVSRLKP